MDGWDGWVADVPLLWGMCRKSEGHEIGGGGGGQGKEGTGR